MLSKATAATVSKEVSRLDLVGFTVSISVQQTIINGHSCGPLCLRVLEGLCVVFHRFVCLLILQRCKIPAHEYPSRHSQAFFHYFLSYLVLTFSVMRSFLSIDRAKKKKKKKRKSGCMPQQLFCTRALEFKVGLYTQHWKINPLWEEIFHFILCSASAHMCWSTK